MWACTCLETGVNWQLCEATPNLCPFMAFVLPLSRGSGVKGVHSCKPSTSTKCTEGPRGELNIGLLRGFPEDSYSLGIFDKALAAHKN